MKTVIRWFSLAMTLLLLGGACSSEGGGDGATDAGATDAGDRVTISFLAEGEAEEVQAYEDIVAAFEQEQDAIHVELRFADEGPELIEQLSTALAGDSPPDIFLMNYRDYGQFAAKGAIAPIADRLASSSVLHAEDFYDTAMEPFKFDGTDQTCIPQNASSLVVYYNADMFDAAGLDLPATGWKWEEFLQDAVQLTGGDVYGVGVDPQLIRMAPFIWSNGGQVVDNEANPTRLALDGRLSTQAMQKFFDLRGAYGVSPPAEVADATPLEEQFLDGSLAMYMDSRKVVPTLRTITDFDWDVAPLPILKEPVSVLHSDAYCLTAGSEHPDEAWTFMEFALGPEGQQIASGDGRTVPSLRSLAESDVFLDPANEPSNSQVYLDNIPSLRTVPNIGPWAEIEEMANGLIEEGYYSNVEAAEVAREVVTQTQPLFARDEG